METESDPRTNGAGASPVGGLLKRRRNGDLGEEAVRETVSCGEERIEALLLQKRDNTGELQTAMEHDMVLLRMFMLKKIDLSRLFCLPCCSVFFKGRERGGEV